MLLMQLCVDLISAFVCVNFKTSQNFVSHDVMWLYIGSRRSRRGIWTWRSVGWNYLACRS